MHSAEKFSKCFCLCSTATFFPYYLRPSRMKFNTENKNYNDIYFKQNSGISIFFHVAFCNSLILKLHLCTKSFKFRSKFIDILCLSFLQ